MELLIAGQSYSFISLPTFDDALESGGGTVSFDVRGDVPDPDDLPVIVKSGRQRIFTGIYNSLRVDCSSPRKSTLTCESNFNLTRTRILFGRFEGEATDVLQRLVLACRLEQLLGLPASPVSTRVSLKLNGEFLNEALDLFKQQIGGDWRVRVADGALEVFTPESASLAPFDVGLPQNLCRPGTWCQQVSYEVKPGFYSNVIVAGKNTQLFYADRNPFAVVPAKIDISEAAYPLGSTQRQFPLYKGPTRILEAKITEQSGKIGFVLIITPTEFHVNSGTHDPGLFTVQSIPQGGFTGIISLSADDSPHDSGVEILLDDPTIPHNGSTTLTYKLRDDLPEFVTWGGGAVSLRVVGISGDLFAVAEAQFVIDSP